MPIRKESGDCALRFPSPLSGQLWKCQRKKKPGKVELFIYWLFYLFLNCVRIISGGNFHNFIFPNNPSLIAPSNSIISLLKQHFPEIALTNIFLVHSHKGFCFKKYVLFEFIFFPQNPLVLFGRINDLSNFINYTMRTFLSPTVFENYRGRTVWMWKRVPKV